MTRHIPYLAKMAIVQAELLKLAQAMPIKTKTYGDFGLRVGIPARGPWKALLDHIADQYVTNKEPDLTYLVVNKKTGYPSQIGREPAKPPSSKQKELAKAEGKKIVARHNPTATNPF